MSWEEQENEQGTGEVNINFAKGDSVNMQDFSRDTECNILARDSRKPQKPEKSYCPWYME